MRCLVRDHASPDSPLLCMGQFIYICTFLVTTLVLDRYLACSVVAYIFPLARPWPGIEIQIAFPSFCSRASAFSRLKLTSVTNSQPCRWSHAGPTRTASLRLASRSLSLSLSSSLSGSGITTTHTAPRPAPCAFSFWGRRSVYLITFELARGLRLRNTSWYV